jgi:hypothetical protein
MKNELKLISDIENRFLKIIEAIFKQNQSIIEMTKDFNHPATLAMRDGLIYANKLYKEEIEKIENNK